jgi:D-alanyl-D-alanine carboxypeptidase
MAAVLAEGVAGSIENFADEMNTTAHRLGMIQSSFVNPNGLPADDQIVSARDMAILARAIVRDLPEYDYFWHLPGIRFGRMVQRNYNTLLGRYPGADGMKTGFICASGFNLVASATRDGRRLIAVVLGAPSSAVRAIKAAQLLERGFNTNTGLSWLMPTMGTVDSVQPVDAAPPNLRDQMCGPHRKRPATEDEDDSGAVSNAPDTPYGIFLSSLQPAKAKGALLQEGQMGEPVLVYTGTKPPPPGAAAAAAADAKPKKKAVAVKPSAGKDAAKDDTAAASSSDNAVAKPKPKAPAAKDGATSTASTSAGEGTPPKPKPKKPAPKETAKDASKDGSKDAAAPAAAAGDAAPKPKPKKPAPKPTVITPPAQQTSGVQ